MSNETGFTFEYISKEKGFMFDYYKSQFEIKKQQHPIVLGNPDPYYKLNEKKLNEQKLNENDLNKIKYSRRNYMYQCFTSIYKDNIPFNYRRNRKYKLTEVKIVEINY